MTCSPGDPNTPRCLSDAEAVGQRLRYELEADRCFFSPFMIAKAMPEMGGGMGVVVKKDDSEEDENNDDGNEEETTISTRIKEKKPPPPTTPPSRGEKRETSAWLPAHHVIAVLPFWVMITVAKARRHLALIEVEYEREYPLCSSHSPEEFPLSLFSPSSAPSSSSTTTLSQPLNEVPYFLFFASHAESASSFSTATSSTTTSGWSNGLEHMCGWTPGGVSLDEEGNHCTTTSSSSTRVLPTVWRGHEPNTSGVTPSTRTTRYSIRHRDHVLQVEKRIASQLSGAETLAAYLGLMRLFFSPSEKSALHASSSSTSKKRRTVYFYHENAWMKTWITSLPRTYDNGLEVQWRDAPPPTLPSPSSSCAMASSLQDSTSMTRFSLATSCSTSTKREPCRCPPPPPSVLPAAFRHSLLGFSRLDRKMVREQEAMRTSYERSLDTLSCLRELPHGIDLRARREASTSSTPDWETKRPTETCANHHEEKQPQNGEEEAASFSLSFIDYIWCWNTVASRGFSFPLETWVLMPYVDYFNYSLFSTASMSEKKKKTVSSLHRFKSVRPPLESCNHTNGEGKGTMGKKKAWEKGDRRKNFNITRGGGPLDPKTLEKRNGKAKWNAEYTNVVEEEDEEEEEVDAHLSDPQRYYGPLSRTTSSSSPYIISSSTSMPRMGKDYVFVFTTRRAVQIGEQIFLCYGSYSDMELWMWYGFTLRPVLLPIKERSFSYSSSSSASTTTTTSTITTGFPEEAHQKTPNHHQEGEDTEHHPVPTTTKEDQENEEKKREEPTAPTMPTISSSASPFLSHAEEHWLSWEVRRRDRRKLVHILQRFLEPTLVDPTRIKRNDPHPHGSTPTSEKQNEEDDIKSAASQEEHPWARVHHLEGGTRERRRLPSPPGVWEGFLTWWNALPSSTAQHLLSSLSKNVSSSTGWTEQHSTTTTTTIDTCFTRLHPLFVRWCKELQTVFSFVFSSLQNMDGDFVAAEEEEEELNAPFPYDTEDVSTSFCSSTPSTTNAACLTVKVKRAEEQKWDAGESSWLHRLVFRYLTYSPPLTTEKAMAMWKVTTATESFSKDSFSSSCPMRGSLFEFLSEEDAHRAVKLDAKVRIFAWSCLCPLLRLTLPSPVSPPFSSSMTLLRAWEAHVQHDHDYKIPSMPIIDTEYASLGCFYPSSYMKNLLKEVSLGVQHMWSTYFSSLEPSWMASLLEDDPGEAADDATTAMQKNQKNKPQRISILRRLSALFLRSIAWMEWYTEASRSFTVGTGSGDSGNSAASTTTTTTPATRMDLDPKGKREGPRDMGGEEAARGLHHHRFPHTSFASRWPSTLISQPAVEMGIQVADDMASLLYTLSICLSTEALMNYISREEGEENMNNEDEEDEEGEA